MIANYPANVTELFIDLKEDTQVLRGHNGFHGHYQHPALRRGQKRGKGIMTPQRRCTAQYKIRAIEACARGLLYRDKPLHRRKRRLVKLLGISTDEALRMKPNRHNCIDNEYPLIDLSLSRRDCMTGCARAIPNTRQRVAHAWVARIAARASGLRLATQSPSCSQRRLR